MFVLVFNECLNIVNLVWIEDIYLIFAEGPDDFDFSHSDAITSIGQRTWHKPTDGWTIEIINKPISMKRKCDFKCLLNSSNENKRNSKDCLSEALKNENFTLLC